MYSYKPATIFSVLLLSLLCFHLASGKPVIVSLPGRSVQLRAEVADFGYQFDQLTTHPANLMLAPEEDPYLCSYPTSLENAPPRDASSPIALFVSRGECSFEEKAMVALAIQQNFTQDLQYVIIYNNDRTNPSQLIRMGAIGLDLPTLGFVAVSTRAGSYTMSSILYAAEKLNKSPFLSANETDWEYPIEMEEFRSNFSRGSTGANTFYLLRFILFSMLILAPCLRAGYLWYNGGGRIAFSRNERGRITGLQYIRPIPYWFAPTAQATSGEPERSRLLTEDQVLGLPEITYEKDDDDEDSTDNSSVESDVIAVEPPKEGAPEPDIVVLAAENDEEKGQTSQVSMSNDEESPEAFPAQESPEGLTTTCTMCSICIDEFENGERIRVLPKCKHGFHTDCLMPWLTERQGNCPLCKRSVLGPDDEESVDGENRDVETGVELVNQAQHASGEHDVESGDAGESREQQHSEAIANVEEPGLQIEASGTRIASEDLSTDDAVTADTGNEISNQSQEGSGPQEQATRTEDSRIGDSPV